MIEVVAGRFMVSSDEAAACIAHKDNSYAVLHTMTTNPGGLCRILIMPKKDAWRIAGILHHLQRVICLFYN